MIVVLALFGADWFARRDPAPLAVTEVELIDGTNFEARLSTAPVVPNEGPAELAPKAETDTEPVDLARPDAAVEVPDMPLFAETDAPPVERPDIADLVLPPPPTVVPTEAPRPSIARIPSPDPLQRQAPEPESPAATEPLQPLASAPAPVIAPQPVAPPPPEPTVADEPQPKPEEPEQKPEPQPEAVAAAQPDAPISNAPQEARLPAAKPAKVAAAARASSAPPPVAAAPKPAETPPQPQQPAGGSTSAFAAAVTIGEKDALRVGIKRYFVYNGNRADRSLQVTIRIQLGEDATIIGEPELLAASGGDSATQDVLFRAGRRALLKAQVAGEFRKLPPAKYNGWKLIHVTFTPEEIGFSS